MTLDQQIDAALDKLNPRQRRFVLHYSTSGNLTQAYMAAGFNSATPDSAESNARRLIQQPKVAEALRLIQQRESAKHDITREYLVNHVRKVLKTEPEYPPTHRDHLRAVELLARMFGFDTHAGGEKVEPDIRFDRLTPEEMATYERLTRKACGHSVDEPPASPEPD